MNKINLRIRLHSIFKGLWVSIIFSGCAINPQNADIGLDMTLPESKVTIYDQAIHQLGLMTTIYSDSQARIMTKYIVDNTGFSTSMGTMAEIPRDITEIVKSTLIAMGGNVSYIPYDPVFMKEMVSTTTAIEDYYHQVKPQIILTGGITEFDRGLVTNDDSLEIEAEMPKKILGIGLDGGSQSKSSLASLTLDFNLIDHKTNTGIPRVQAINGIKLHKATRSDSIGFTVKSATFGARGEITKVQGRHAAVRLLVQLSMMQIIGRYQNLPYWRLVPGAVRDEFVIEQILEEYRSISQTQKISKVQELLYLHGYNVLRNGEMDAQTQNSLHNFSKVYNYATTALDENLYLLLYENVPITNEARRLRQSLSKTTITAVKASPINFTLEQSKISLVLNKTQFRIGETLQVGFTVSKPMYVRLVNIDANGSLVSLFPNTYQSDNFCIPGKIYHIPSSSNAEFSIKITGPAGVDKLRAVASSEPIPADHLYFTAEGNFDETKMAKYSVRAAADFTVVH